MKSYKNHESANNEIGTLQPIQKIGEIARERDIFFHVDASQSIGKIPMDVQKFKIDLLSFTAHKMYGPKGVGALYVRRRNPRVRVSPLMHGGGHERGMRSGTLNVPSIVGLGAACHFAAEEMQAENERLWSIRNKFFEKVSDKIDLITLNAHQEHTVAGILNISFNYVEGESLMMGFDGIAVSSGSACTSASLEPSYVLRALGLGDESAHSSIRFSFGRFTTEEEVNNTIDIVVSAVSRLREMSPLYEMVKEGIDLSTVQWTGH
jgi:cysteine desulfurase